MSVVKIFTSPNCPLCMILKNFLSSIGVKYLEMDISNINVMTELIMNNVFVTSVPILEVDGRYFFVNDLFEDSKLRSEFILKILGRS
ncbi:MAG: glutaredoxin domain-containing protein [Candidatus Methanomethylicia archaeon]